MGNEDVRARSDRQQCKHETGLYDCASALLVESHEEQARQNNVFDVQPHNFPTCQ